MKNICVLFDMDGVMLDTETQYDNFWKQSAGKYKINIPNFEKQIKGTTLPNILEKYFSNHTEDEIDTLVADLDKFEAAMSYPEIRGSIRFVETLKAQGIKIGLVTSSTDSKLKNVYRETNFNTLFDTIVSAGRIVNGKPAPDCFLLAAKDLGVDPKDCIVFEDSFAGIEAGTAAGMKVVGVATTHPANLLKSKCIKIISDFETITIEDLKNI